MFNVIIYEDEQGKKPLKEWMKSLTQKTRLRLFERFNRISNGNLGDYKRIGTGLFELRFFFDGGIRVYFGRDGAEIIILLCGGDKQKQQKDIEKAKEYWRQYLDQKEN